MERVSYKTAKAIKDAGYPQDYKNTEDTYTNLNGGIWVKPTYIEVWLWLWREKGFRFELAHPEYKGEYDFDKLYCNVTSGSGVTDDYSDPEKAIIAAVEYLVDNNFIK